MKELDKVQQTETEATTMEQKQDDAQEAAQEAAQQAANAPISRRDFIRWGTAGVGVAAALPLFGGTAEAARALRTADTEGQEPAAAAAVEREEMLQAAADKALSLLVAPIAAGTALGSMNVESVRVDRRGVGIVELADGRGRNYLAEVCRRTQQDARVTPLASTKNYSLYLYNNGSGSVPTDEQVGRAIVAVGDRVRANEESVEVLALRSRKELWQTEGYLG